MINIKKAAIGAVMALCLGQGLQAEPVVMNTPPFFSVLGVSPNGHWACGAFLDMGGNYYGFRWNLVSNEIEMLSSQETSLAWDIANDGTVSGEFNDREVFENKAPLAMPGYNRDGRWHHLELPSGYITDEGMAGCISPDGRFMTGTIVLNGLYTPVVWEDGKVRRVISGTKNAVSYAIAPDGTLAAGWAEKSNRTAAVWKEGEKTIYLDDEATMVQSPWSYARNCSPDGTKVVYWGGWLVDSDNGKTSIYAVYDTTTGERIAIPNPEGSDDLEFHDVTNNGLVLGQFGNGRGYIYDLNAKQGYSVDEFLAAKGVDISKYPDLYSGTDGYEGTLPIEKVVAGSEDGSVLAMHYYNTQGRQASLIVKLDEDVDHMAPACVKATKMAGINNVSITWKAPYGASAIRGYNVYRDGRKINGILPINALYFYDKNVDEGTHSYEVACVNVAGEETRAEAIEVAVDNAVDVAPLEPFSRQKGINNALITWKEPLAKNPYLRYSNLTPLSVIGFTVYQSIDVEAAVRFDKDVIANYDGYKVSEVSFIPMAQHRKWAVNFYTRRDGELKLIASQPITQPLTYRQRNTVKLDTPVALPAGDLYAAIEVGVDAGNGTAVLGAEDVNVTVGYSDLLRQKEEPDFYSAFERAMENEAGATCMSWCIDLGLTNDNLPAPAVTGYNIYHNGEAVAKTTDTRYEMSAMEDGDHTFGIEATYSDGSVSQIATTLLSVKAQLVGVSDVNIENIDDHTVKATWDRPVDNDASTISYTRATKNDYGIKGFSSNGYALMLGAEYPASMLRGYEGYKVTTLNFYPLCDAIFTFYLYENDKEILNYEIDDFKIGQWNRIEIPTSVTIAEGATYRFVIDVFDPEPDTDVMGVEYSYPVPYQSDLFSTDNGDNWSSLITETDRPGNWMMSMSLVAPTATEIAIDGYDVYVDSKKANAEMLTAPEYTHDFGANDTKNHSMRVDTYYTARATTVKGGVTRFMLMSGLESNVIASITLRQGQNTLVAEGEGVTSLTIYNTAGVKVMEVAGNEANITDIAAGTYVVQATTAAGTKTFKVKIK